MKKVIVPLEQQHHRLFWEQEIYLQPQTTLNTGALSSTASQSQLDFHVYQTPGKECKGFCIEYDVQETGGSNSVSLTPSPFFQDRIEYRTSDNKLLWTGPNFMLFKNLALLDANQAREWFPLHGLNEYWKPNVNATLRPNQKQTFFLMVLGDPFTTNGNIFMDWQGYIIVRLFLQSAVESGTGTLSLNSCALRIFTIESVDKHNPNYEFEHKYNFIDYQSITTDQKTISAAQVKVKCQNFLGHNLVSDLVLRSSVATANGAYRNFVSLGRQSQIAYEDKNGSNLIGGGYYDGNQSRLIKASRHVAGTFYKYNPVYPIYFGDLELAQKFGRLQGAIEEDSYNSYDIISSPDGLNAPVLTITPNGTAASGYYSITFTSPVTNLSSTTAPLAYNATAAEIQAALYALSNWDDSNINTVTVSGPLTAAATFTFAGNWYADDFAAQVTANTLVANNISTATSGSVVVPFQSALTTAGNSGFTSTNLRVDIYSSIMRAFTIDKKGNINVLDKIDKRR